VTSNANGAVMAFMVGFALRLESEARRSVFCVRAFGRNVALVAVNVF
jgi:hypothetical protein